MNAFGYDFVQRALAAVLLVAPVLGGLSHLIVARRLSFFTAAVAQSALAGVCVAVWLGESVSAPWAGLFGTCVCFALGLTFVRRQAGLHEDASVGVMLPLVLAAGVCLLVVVTKRFNIHQLESVLFGSVLTVTSADLWFVALTSVVAGAFLWPGYNRLLVHSVESTLVAPRRFVWLDYGFSVAVAVLVVGAVKLFGALLAQAMLTLPAVIGRNVARSLRGVLVSSVLAVALAGVCGVSLSTVVNVPSGASVALVLGLFFAISFAFSGRRKR